MKPLPKAAMPVVKVLRRDVPRPKTLPTLDYETPNCCGYTYPRWNKFVNPHDKGLQHTTSICPMGLHKNSKDYMPVHANEFDDQECSEEAVTAFWKWWDALLKKDLPEAMDAVWPKKRSKK